MTFEDLKDEIIALIEATELRTRSRKAENKLYFDYAVRQILIDLWKSLRSIPAGEVSINKRSGYYSENKRYRDPYLTYTQTMAAFNGLERLGFIEITQKGYFDRNHFHGKVTRFIAKGDLLAKLSELKAHPAITLSSPSNTETILLRDRIDGKRTLIDYEDDELTVGYRKNISELNSCFLRHWCDLEIRDVEVAKLEERIRTHKTKEPVDFSKRSLVRIFTNGSFKQGGRFYRGWWQNVPREYRQYITINEKRTGEGDFSQLNPHMLYLRNNKELGSEDAYGRVFEGEHRDLVKEAFNAMIQATSPLNNCPKDIDLSELNMTWKELRNRILTAHEPIAHEFFKGIGNELQFEDSCIAESVMLHFAKMDSPALPVHDSFILFHGFCENGEVEEAMRRAFFERFHADIPIKQEIIDWTYRKDTADRNGNNFRPLDIETILQADNDVSKWRERHSLWYKHKELSSSHSP
jgi:hypothetical protein